MYHELIGLEIKILQHTDPTLVGVKGQIVDETMKTLLIEKSNGKRIRVFKANGVYQLELPDGSYVVLRGDRIVGRPWDRLKKLLTAKR